MDVYYLSNVFCTYIISYNFHFDICQINQNVITHLNESIGNILFIHLLDYFFFFKLLLRNEIDQR